MTRLAVTGWTDLLDRVEARLRRLDAAATAPRGIAVIDPGPDPTLEPVPMVAPTAFERVRLAAVLDAHRVAEAKLAASRAASS